jgi:hypothetical protein
VKYTLDPPPQYIARMYPTVPTLESSVGIFFDEDAALDYLLEKEVFYYPRLCDQCASPTTLRRDRQILRCTKHSCRKESSIRRGTFFARTKLSLSKTLLIGYSWLLKVPQVSMVSMLGSSASTVAAFCGHYRQLVADDLDMEDFVIGGEGIIVEVDECKLGKRKHNRGHPVEGVWVLGGVERTSERRVFAVPVPNRSSDTLLNILVNHVRPGSIVMTDLWRGYTNLVAQLGVEHQTVNHSTDFVNPEDGTCTNTIEGTWNGMKLCIAIRKRTEDLVGDCLLEFIWRRKNATALWDGLIAALNEVHYD